MAHSMWISTVIATVFRIPLIFTAAADAAAFQRDVATFLPTTTVMTKNNSATSSKERKNSARGVLINESNQHSTLDKILEKEVDNNESQFQSSVTSSELDSSESSLESSGDDDYEEE